MHIAVVDDQPADRARLINEIKECVRESTRHVSVMEYESGEQFLQQAQFDELDAVFLDIYMNELSGMDVAYKIREHDQTCQIVFVTTSADFAVQSYEVRAFYYILKPYDHGAIAKVMRLLDANLKKSARYIMVKEGREWCKVLLSDILYADYHNHYVQIHTESAIISTYMKFPEIENTLCEYRAFLSCYRCIVVNMDKIQKMDTDFFLLCNGEYIPINRKRSKIIKSHYVDYMFDVSDEDENNGV